MVVLRRPDTKLITNLLEPHIGIDQDQDPGFLHPCLPKPTLHVVNLCKSPLINNKVVNYYTTSPIPSPQHQPPPKTVRAITRRALYNSLYTENNYRAPLRLRKNLWTEGPSQNSPPNNQNKHPGPRPLSPPLNQYSTDGDPRNRRVEHGKASTMPGVG